MPHPPNGGRPSCLTASSSPPLPSPPRPSPPPSPPQPSSPPSPSLGIAHATAVCCGGAPRAGRYGVTRYTMHDTAHDGTTWQARHSSHAPSLRAVARLGLCRNLRTSSPSGTPSLRRDRAPQQGEGSLRARATYELAARRALTRARGARIASAHVPTSRGRRRYLPTPRPAIGCRRRRERCGRRPRRLHRGWQQS